VISDIDGSGCPCGREAHLWYLTIVLFPQVRKEGRSMWVAEFRHYEVEVTKKRDIVTNLLDSLTSIVPSFMQRLKEPGVKDVGASKDTSC
jgi:hypothetical protein